MHIAPAVEVHVRGERQPRYYRKHCIRFGEWKREWFELVFDKDEIRELGSAMYS
jgi:hypothetical protein